VKIGSVSKSLYLVLMIPIIKYRVEDERVCQPASSTSHTSFFLRLCF